MGRSDTTYSDTIRFAPHHVVCVASDNLCYVQLRSRAFVHETGCKNRASLLQAPQHSTSLPLYAEKTPTLQHSNTPAVYRATAT